MTQALREPLPTALGSIAIAMRSGLPQVTAGKGGGSYNWREVVAAQRDLALQFLRQRVEQGSEGRRTVREASLSLLPPQFPTEPIFLVVICEAGRPEGTVSRVQRGDILYLITAPNAVAEGMVLRRLN